jgi:hypothetical protein
MNQDLKTAISPLPNNEVRRVFEEKNSTFIHNAFEHVLQMERLK